MPALQQKCLLHFFNQLEKPYLNKWKTFVNRGHHINRYICHHLHPDYSLGERHKRNESRGRNSNSLNNKCSEGFLNLTCIVKIRYYKIREAGQRQSEQGRTQTSEHLLCARQRAEHWQGTVSAGAHGISIRKLLRSLPLTIYPPTFSKTVNKRTGVQLTLPASTEGTLETHHANSCPSASRHGSTGRQP